MTRIATASSLLCVLLAGCDVSLNDDIEVSAGNEPRGDTMSLNGDVVVGEGAVIDSGELKTVNGRIQIAEGANVRSCRTVNGSIEVGADARTGDLESVNGDLLLQSNVHVGGDIRLVNGRVELERGVVVAGNVGTVNGAILLRGATVEGDLSNYEGGMTVTDGSVVAGGLRVRKPKGTSADTLPTIIIGPSSEVRGAMSFERPVNLYVHETATIGTVSGAEVQHYAGETPGPG